ncbi:MAG: protein kinase [Deltaproteobacteria bacterium]|nr:protein kinase [Deltaproteobacteria bacterium]
MPILTDDERIGSTIDGKYLVQSVLGRGGMATVFAATHTWTQRQVAIKVLQPQLAQNPEIVRRFLREARAAASFRHPNVVEVLDMGALPEGGAYLALSKLEGETLADRLSRGGAMTVSECYAALLPVMNALAIAHERGIIHRDVKPENIFLARNDTDVVVPTLLDFGIAKVLDLDTSSSTREGVIIGTPQYMAPEQARGVHDLDARADVWAMGIVWYECLSLCTPFDGASPTAILARLLTESASPLLTCRSDVPAAVALVIDRALSTDRTLRPLHMRAMLDAMIQAGVDSEISLRQSLITEANGPFDADAPTAIERVSDPNETDPLRRLPVLNAELQPTLVSPLTRSPSMSASVAAVTASTEAPKHAPRAPGTALAIVGAACLAVLVTVAAMRPPRAVRAASVSPTVIATRTAAPQPIAPPTSLAQAPVQTLAVVADAAPAIPSVASVASVAPTEVRRGRPSRASHPTRHTVTGQSPSREPPAAAPTAPQRHGTMVISPTW